MVSVGDGPSARNQRAATFEPCGNAGVLVAQTFEIRLVEMKQSAGLDRDDAGLPAVGVLHLEQITHMHGIGLASDIPRCKATMDHEIQALPWLVMVEQHPAGFERDLTHLGGQLCRRIRTQSSENRVKTQLIRSTEGEGVKRGMVAQLRVTLN
ncbi:MAG: hypothetical protein LLG14_02585 [Nocardiaceae bacterium]|nr:hypothetical protein [Nocardiaceae bacterium]